MAALASSRIGWGCVVDADSVLMVRANWFGVEESGWRMSKAYYNEVDPAMAATLRELIRAGLIAPGDVDERSVEDVLPSELAGYTQCHFFAGLGVWSAEFRPPGRDSLCPSGASLVSTMAAPSGFCRGSGCEKKSFPVLRVSRY